MKKVLLVIFVGMVLAIGLYGVVDGVENESYIEETTITINIE